MTGKLAFILFVVALLIVGAVMGVSRYRANAKASDLLGTGTDGKQAESGKRRIFNTDPPPPLPGSAAGKATAPSFVSSAACADSTSGRPLLGPDGQQMTAPSGQPIRVCSNGQVVVPAIISLPGESVQPIPVIANKGASATLNAARAPASRYGGDVVVPATTATTASAPLDPQNPYIQALLRSSAPASNGAAPIVPGASVPMSPTPAETPHGAIGSLLKGSEAKAVLATMIGDRDMILPEGRSIDCNLSVRIINEVSGKATCVLSSNVYSDSGRVVLAERGSTAVGEYVATMAQGQRRLFVLWTRLQTPNGVVINVNSPAADALGTSGLPGHVDNRWSERIGAAVLLSLVEDAITYVTAKAANADNNGAQGIAVLQSTTQTGRGLAERILDSTINIKPTIYKNQGDRATIFVSRDLDFGSVYALRAK